MDHLATLTEELMANSMDAPCSVALYKKKKLYNTNASMHVKTYRYIIWSHDLIALALKNIKFGHLIAIFGTHSICNGWSALTS